ncbi:hypothetical protein Cadr_000011360 [Camelus dromedarius]|uniref:Uncharacterized protein n=1 Tax=Camelus dromedarius TaxID=9838 RepID=A0A5N4DS78_CAMDR|nr:hypothetical protein Cadr_000011360 [Camelus dromedarius]
MSLMSLSMMVVTEVPKGVADLEEDLVEVNPARVLAPANAKSANAPPARRTSGLTLPPNGPQLLLLHWRLLHLRWLLHMQKLQMHLLQEKRLLHLRRFLHMQRLQMHLLQEEWLLHLRRLLHMQRLQMHLLQEEWLLHLRWLLHMQRLQMHLLQEERLLHLCQLLLMQKLQMHLLQEKTDSEAAAPAALWAVPSAPRAASAKGRLTSAAAVPDVGETLSQM